MLTDTHCHLDFYHYEKDRLDVLKRAWSNGLERILVPGVDLESSRSAIHLTKVDSKVFVAIGVHPNSASTWNGSSYETLLSLSHHPKVVAIGEIGLDYYRNRAPIPIQKKVFKDQLHLAASRNLPVIIHTRNKNPNDRRCISDLIDILSEWKSALILPGVIHSFSGNLEEAKKIIELGFYIGITGPITFKNASVLREVVESIPLEWLLIETDAPFLSPHPYRGKRNEPAYVRYIAEKISEVRQCSLETVKEQTSANAQVLFRWNDVE